MHVVNEYMDENVENEKKKILTQLPKVKKNPLLLKELVKVKSFSDNISQSFVPTKNALDYSLGCCEVYAYPGKSDG